MQDMYFKIKAALSAGTLPALITKYHADPGIKLELSPKPVIIAPEAYYRRSAGKDSLEHIASITRRTNREVAFAGIIDEHELTIGGFIKGIIGDSRGCDWESGALLKRALHWAKETRGKISIGHNHSVFYKEGDDKKSGIDQAYGAICSDGKYERGYLKKLTNKTSRIILRSKLYEKYGSDYCSMYATLRTHEMISRYFWILSPRLDQIGVFEIRRGGHVVYHPWIIGE